ncbi:MAG: class I SAM-dependent methyltransferase [Promethearchaeota archaeon]|nr:MAG: class I SAM-dependent methyltransferase [Candidatus Lokiarchaeota archaeon]
MWYHYFVKRKFIFDFILRLIIKIYLKFRFRKEPKDVSILQQYINSFIAKMNNSPISINTDKANEQHYELPPAFFELVLGKHLKYSCGIWHTPMKRSKLLKHLNKSEEDMLDLTFEHANIIDGHNILELGCGWGSFSIYLAKRCPNSQIVAVTNSKDQKNYLESKINQLDLKNLKILKKDVKQLDLDEKFDRIVSIEMFEHMRNYKRLLNNISNFIKDDGKLFVHIFTDDNYPYFFETDGRSSWMARNFFRGGLMPSTDLLFYFTEDFIINEVWKINGINYKNTLNAWLRKFDKHRKKIKKILIEHYGKKEWRSWKNYWRFFFLALSEVFGYKHGNKRYVTHYLLNKR